MSESLTVLRPRQAVALPDRVAARLVLRQLARWPAGLLRLTLPDGQECHFGAADGSETVAVTVHAWRFFRRVLTGGEIGVGESYMDGDWSCSDLVALCHTFLTDQAVLDQRSPWTVARRGIHAVQRWARANTLRGSRRNISHHYDLSNELFGLFLDDSMMYSAATFDTPGLSLAAAQRAKLDGICRGLDLQPDQHVLEIGSGWGGFALHAAREYGARVTSLTLSHDQHRLARQRVDAAGLSERIDIQLCDYRQASGRFDHIVSIEMFEAVGLEYYDAFFGACERLLSPHGRMFLQTIAMPDQRFDAYRRDYDWLRKYIFPGTLLASLHEVTASLKRVTGLRIESLRDIGPDYARTLRLWRERFLAQRSEVRRLGFDDRFIRMWEYYLASCEAAFAVRYINDLQLVLSRPLPFARQLAAPARAAA
ncbi:MAG: cyclopropane-fatty-acyl-phospholipid synthase family protein [bacterium]